MLWEIDVHPSPDQPDRLAERVRSDIHAIWPDLCRAGDSHTVQSAQGYLVQGELDEMQAQRLAKELLVDAVVEVVEIEQVFPPGSRAHQSLNWRGDYTHSQVYRTPTLVHVLPKPGVMDPVADSALRASRDLGLRVEAVRTLRKFWILGLSEGQVRTLCAKSLANDAIEQVVVGPLRLERLEMGSPYEFRLVTVPLRNLHEDELQQLSRQNQLSLSLAEMRTIQAYFRELGREPTDAELETLAQTWSEHCSHKTLKGRIRYRDERGERQFDNMLKETIFAATQQVRRDLGADDWCVSVFEDNAGIVRFDDEFNVAFKVETHNHPSAIEPYGGANTGLGGVIRDTLGTGLGAKPVCSTDVFCFAPPDMPADQLPPGVLHPQRVMKGVVAGVRDYGNRMGIPTVNGAIYFDERYLGNPLVFCGNVGLIPRQHSRKEPRPGDLIVAVGGRTGRDGIHGATFSSVELTSESETISGGSVQIGNAITEKMLADVLLTARDRGLYHAVTDCGAGGFSSAVGEMGEKIGAEVRLEVAPLKYAGLSYTEIWISEAQERMVLAVPPAAWSEFQTLCASEGVEATALGTFTPTGRLVLKYHDQVVADLSMKFLHDGRPPVVREAVYDPAPSSSSSSSYSKSAKSLQPASAAVISRARDFTPDLLRILGSLNVASKEWVIRQYDHEVQAGSVIKPLVGAMHDGPSDAAVVRPRLDSRRGLVIACGMNPHFGGLDPYAMAASAIDEAVRNCVAVGADPRRIALLDNFCWGNTQRAEQLGSLVRAALACHDLAIALGTPFISGKDSLNNEYRYDENGQRRTISIPPTLLISAIGQIGDVRTAVTMDLKEPGNYLYLVGMTRDELGGSQFELASGVASAPRGSDPWSVVRGQKGGDGISGLRGCVPFVDPVEAKATFAALHQAIERRLVRACHDLSEGGLAVAAAEMAFAGGLGAKLSLAAVPCESSAKSASDVVVRLFSESNSRFLCEVRPTNALAFEAALACSPFGRIGETTHEDRLRIVGDDGRAVIDADLATLKEAWQSPLRWE